MHSPTATRLDNTRSTDRLSRISDTTHRLMHTAAVAIPGAHSAVRIEPPAAKLAIAARLDLYRGTPDHVFLKKAQARIDAAGIVP